MSREEAESKLIFAGFVAFECKTRGDSSAIMKALITSGHRCLMLTGDAPLTSVHVAKETSMIDTKKPPFLLTLDSKGDISWKPMLFKHKSLSPEDFVPEAIPELCKNYELIVTEDALLGTEET
eukprot:UN32491